MSVPGQLAGFARHVVGSTIGHVWIVRSTRQYQTNIYATLLLIQARNQNSGSRSDTGD